MKLNLPQYDLKTRTSSEGKIEIFDPIRKKYVILTPEEWVRQNFLQYLIKEKGFPQSLISVEKGLTVNQLHKRFDAVAYNNTGKPVVLLEFKAPDIKISQRVFEQIAAYNISLKVNYLIVSNGMNHYCCQVNFKENDFKFLSEIPMFPELE